MKKKYFGIGMFVGIIATMALFAADGTIQTWTGKGSRRNTVEMELRSASIGSAAALLPGTTETNDIGSTSLYWNEVYTEGIAFGTAVSTTSSPSQAGLLRRNSSNELYISTGTGAGAWVKVGAQ